MSAIEQVFTIGIVKDEHPRLHAEALAELAKLRADLAEAQRERYEALARVANQSDSLDHWLDLWSHIVTRLGGFGTLPNESNFDALLDPKLVTLTPRRCVTCARDAAREMRENAESICRDWNRAPYLAGSNFGGDSIPFAMRFHLADAISALPLPAECADCNPLKPESEATR